jgi:hypothetical protein
MAIARHLKGSRRNRPDDHMRSQYDVSNEAKNGVRFVRSTYPAEIGTDCDEVHKEGDSCDGEKHYRRPELSGRRPRVYISSYDFVLGKEVFGEREGENSHHVGVENQRAESRDKAEDANAAFVSLDLLAMSLDSLDCPYYIFLLQIWLRVGKPAISGC